MLDEDLAKFTEINEGNSPTAWSHKAYDDALEERERLLVILQSNLERQTAVDNGLHDHYRADAQPPSGATITDAQLDSLDGNNGTS